VEKYTFIFAVLFVLQNYVLFLYNCSLSWCKRNACWRCPTFWAFTCCCHFVYVSP